MTIKERLDYYSEPVTESGCWIWTGTVNSKGYGRITINGRSAQYAHRISYQEHIGRIPNSLELMHSCDNPSCINHSHLSVGTHKDNMQDAVNKGRNHRECKLTTDEVVFIKKSLRQFGGYGACAELARKYGVDVSTVSAIKRGETWAHITV